MPLCGRAPHQKLTSLHWKVYSEQPKRDKHWYVESADWTLSSHDVTDNDVCYAIVANTRLRQRYVEDARTGHGCRKVTQYNTTHEGNEDDDDDDDQRTVYWSLLHRLAWPRRRREKATLYGKED